MSTDEPGPRQRALVSRALQSRSYCTLATCSASGRPHVVGVLYAVADGAMWISTLADSVKVRNISENARVAICVPVRRYPLGPPFSVQLQGTAEVILSADARAVAMVVTGALKRITSHGELDHPASCFVRVAPRRRVAVYGLGVPLRRLLRDPLAASYSIDLQYL